MIQEAHIVEKTYYELTKKYEHIEEEINKMDHVFESSSMNMDDGDWTIDCVIDGRQ